MMYAFLPGILQSVLVLERPADGHHGHGDVQGHTVDTHVHSRDGATAHRVAERVPHHSCRGREARVCDDARGDSVGPVYYCDFGVGAV